MHRIWPALLPELRRFPDSERSNALRLARERPLDAFEWVAMAVGLVVVTALTKFAVPDPSMASRVLVAALNFAVALPMLVAVLGPFHLRRLRRGLRALLDEQGRP